MCTRSIMKKFLSLYDTTECDETAFLSCLSRFPLWVLIITSPESNTKLIKCLPSHEAVYRISLHLLSSTIVCTLTFAEITKVIIRAFTRCFLLGIDTCGSVLARVRPVTKIIVYKNERVELYRSLIRQSIACDVEKKFEFSSFLFEISKKSWNFKYFSKKSWKNKNHCLFFQTFFNNAREWRPNEASVELYTWQCVLY